MAPSHDEWVVRIDNLLDLVADPFAVAVLNRCRESHAAHETPEESDRAIRDELWETYAEDLDEEDI